MSKLYILRGLPGSGKSTYAKSIGCFHIEADMFHVKNGSYEFEQSNISKSHNFCKSMVIQAMLHKVDIAVSNTHTMLWEFEFLLDSAKTFGYEVEVISCQGQYGNIHTVPEETLVKMKARWQPFQGEIIIGV